MSRGASRPHPTPPHPASPRPAPPPQMIRMVTMALGGEAWLNFMVGSPGVGSLVDVSQHLFMLGTAMRSGIAC